MSLKIVVISDTHEKHTQVEVPDGDMLIHCGDWTFKGAWQPIENFLNWFVQLPHKYKLFIPGNHELSLDGKNKDLVIDKINKFTNENVHFLLNSSVTIDGLKFYGSPATPFYYNWAFNYQRGKDIAVEWGKIPDDVNVLITHGPPYGTLDMVESNIFDMGRDLHQGCKDLRDRIANLKSLKAHVFGHLHTDGGKQIETNRVVYANAAICNEQYWPINPPIIINL